MAQRNNPVKVSVEHFLSSRAGDFQFEIVIFVLISGGLFSRGLDRYYIVKLY